jgi:RNA recognition motif-containing protein
MPMPMPMPMPHPMAQMHPFARPMRPPAAGPATIPIASASVPVEPGVPSRTLYLQNLPERLPSNAQLHLKPYLRDLFAPFGPIARGPLVRRRLACHGQAWIVYERMEDARAALDALQGYRIWGKTLVVRFASRRSDEVVRAEGGAELVAAEHKRRSAEKQAEKLRSLAQGQPARITRRQQLAPLMTGAGSMIGAGAAAGSASFTASMARGPRPMRPGLGLPMSVPPSAASAATGSSFLPLGADVQLPNRTLFLQQLPVDYETGSLAELFKQLPGFVDLRRVAARMDVAFVEFETEAQAAVARQSLDRHSLREGAVMRVSFAKK